MLLKTADDRRHDLASLENLLLLDGLSTRQRELITRQITSIRAGARGENEVAYHLDFSLRDNPDTHVIHDLRIEHGGRVAQINHVVVSRYRFVYALETKNLNAGLQCNARGEWTAWYGPRGKGRPVAIASPIEQAKRHAAVLADWFKAQGMADLEGVTGVVVVSPKTFVGRASATMDAAVPVVRADLFKRWWEEDRETGSLLRAPFLLAARMSRAKLDAVCAALVASHRPVEWNWAAKFGIFSQPESRPGTLPGEFPNRVVTPHGVVMLKRVTDGLLALRHAADPQLAAHVERSVQPHGRWQAHYGNWLVADELICGVITALQTSAVPASAAAPPPSPKLFRA